MSDLLGIVPGGDAVLQNRHPPHIGDAPSLGVRHFVAVAGEVRGQDLDAYRHPRRFARGLAIFSQSLDPKIVRTAPVRHVREGTAVTSPSGAPDVRHPVGELDLFAVRHPQQDELCHLSDERTGVDEGELAPVRRPREVESAF